MSTVTREHLAGLELAFSQAMEVTGSIPMQRHLKDLIAQASAAPEQEPVAYCDDFTLDILKRGAAYSIGVEPAKSTRRSENAIHPLYTHPDAEIERLREDRDSFQRVGIKAAAQLVESQKQLANQRASTIAQIDAHAETRQKLADAQALLREMDSYLGKRGDRQAIHSGSKFHMQISGFLSATAQPAEVVNKQYLTAEYVWLNLLGTLSADNGGSFYSTTAEFADVEPALRDMISEGWFDCPTDDLDGDYWMAAGGEVNEAENRFGESEHWPMVRQALDAVFDRAQPNDDDQPAEVKS